MKKFYFKDELLKINRIYGGAKRQCTIYQLFKNDMRLIGSLEYNTASTMGNISEVHSYLIKNGNITIQEAKKQTKPIVATYNKKGYSDYYYYNCDDIKSNEYIIKEI